MNERVIVAQANSLPLANLVRSHVVKVTKPQSDQAITLDLNNGAGAKLDLSAVANEKMTLVHVDTKLVILFDNQSTVTAEPFFDLSGKPLAGLSVELSAGRSFNGEQFAQSVLISDDQSVLPSNDSSADPSSGANFRDVPIDSLPGIAAPLPLMGLEMPDALGHGSIDTGAGFGVVAHAQLFNTPASTVVGSAPGIVDIPAPGGAGTLVFEAGLLASRGPGESDGTHAGNPAFQTTTRAGTINFTSPDGVESVVLGGNSLSATPTAFPDGTTGALTAWFTFDAATGAGAIHYSYTLFDNTLGTPNANFAVVVTDPDGDRNPPASLVISIVDDGPIAVADTDAFAAGQTTAEAGNVITGIGTTSGFTDLSGADGGAMVVGVAAGDVAGGANPGTVGVAVAGAFGTLTLNADGSYSYTHTGVVGSGTDVFTYTIKDADGSLAHATLTIVGGDSAPGDIVVPPAGQPDTSVFEAGLGQRGGEPAGSHAGDPSFPTTTQTGTITFTSPDGVANVEIGNLTLTSGTPQTFTDATGSLTASFTYNAATGQGVLNYSYTLLDNTLVNPSSVNFAVAVTDLDGDRTPGANLTIVIADDAPVAVADTDSVAAGQLTAETGNVLTGVGTSSGAADVQGADGSLQVLSVAIGNNAVAVNPSASATIAGAFGTLTLAASGSYSYARANGLPGGNNHSDTFTYTIRDADGSQSTATLTIAVADSSPGNITIPPPDVAETTVFEAGLPARVIGGVNEPAGSNPLDQTTAAGTIDFTSPDGVQTVELGSHTLTAVPQTFVDATGSLTASFTYDVATGLGTINYSYTLLDNTLVDPSSTSFAVAVTDLDGDRTPGGVLTIIIVDDTPVAISDTDAVVAGQTVAETGNVLTGIGTASGPSSADVQGADGAVVAGVAAGVTGVNLVNTNTVGVAVAGAFGTLTLNADGSYSYLRTGGGGTDIFTYTIQDGDGDLAHTTLTIVVSDSTPSNIVIPPTGGPETTVFEAGLGARGSEPAGSHVGDAAFPVTTQVGTITFASPDGVQKIELGSLVLNAAGVPQTFSDATGSLTASYTYNAATGQGTINYTYTLLDNTLVDPSSTNFAVAVTDLDGDRTQGGSLVITVVDDTPTAAADTDATAAGQLTAETGNVLTGVGTTSGTADVQGADGAVVAGLSAGNTGLNLVNAGTVGVGIAGAFGTLTLNADGSYSYAHTGAPGGGTDTFTYTVRDGDGDLSHATLTITVADSSPGGIVVPPAGNPAAGTELFEAGLAARGSEPAGSHAGDPAFPTTAAGSAAICRGLADGGICQDRLRNRIIDRESLAPRFSPDTGRAQQNRGDPD